MFNFYVSPSLSCFLCQCLQLRSIAVVPMHLLRGHSRIYSINPCAPCLWFDHWFCMPV